MKAINCALLIIGLMMTIFSCKKDKNEHMTLILQPDGLTGQDATFYTYSPQINYGKSGIIYLYKVYSINTNFSNYSRAAINFNLSSIPINAIIDSALLSLYYSKSDEQSRNNAFCIRRIISPWDENTITWNTQPLSTDSNMVILSKSTSPYQDYPNINVTGIVRNMLDDRDNSFGFLLSLLGEKGGSGDLYFASSNHMDKNIRPKLVIYYVVEP